MPNGNAGNGAHRTVVERKSDFEFVVNRTFDAPARVVFEAWSKPELFQRWWVPKSVGMDLVACEMDVRTGGKYRLVFSHPAFDQPMEFFGIYTDVEPGKRIVWTNDEGDQGGVTTVTFEEIGDKTMVTYSELYPTKEGLEEALAGSAQGLPEQFAQLDGMLAAGR